MVPFNPALPRGSIFGPTLSTIPRIEKLIAEGRLPLFLARHQMSRTVAGLIKPEGRRLVPPSSSTHPYKSAIDAESGTFVSSYREEKNEKRRQQSREWVATWIKRVVGVAVFLVALEYGSKYFFGHFHLRL